MKVSDLTYPQLDYWVARAIGIPAEQLKLRPIPGSDKIVCVQYSPHDHEPLRALNYSKNWALGGPLIEKHALDLIHGFDDRWFATSLRHAVEDAQHGDAPLQAVCRAVVHAVFGDEVEEVAAC